MALLLIFAATAQPKRAKADVKKEKELGGTVTKFIANKENPEVVIEE